MAKQVSGSPHRPNVATAAVVTIAAGVDRALKIRQIDWSLSATLDAPVEITVTVDGTVDYAVYVTNAGPGQLTFVDPYEPPAATTSTVITLPSGGAAVTGTLNVLEV